MMKSKPLFKLTKKEHLDNLIAKLPIISLLYIGQCLLMSWLIKDISIGNYALFLGLTLIAFVTSMYCYDRYHHVILCEEHIHIYFEILGTSKYISYEEIESIVVSEAEVNYGPISFNKKNGEVLTFHFIDYPKHVKSFLIKFINERNCDDIAA